MTKRRYAHLPSRVAQVIWATMPKLGLVEILEPWRFLSGRRNGYAETVARQAHATHFGRISALPPQGTFRGVPSLLARAQRRTLVSLYLTADVN